MILQKKRSLLFGGTDKHNIQITVTGSWNERAEAKTEVNGKKVDIYLAKIADVKNPPDWTLKPEDVGGPYSFSYFDFSGEVNIKITS